MNIGAVIVHYGDPETTMRCAKSVYTIPEISRVVVVDNHGNFPTDFQFASTVHRSDINGGYGAGCNIGARLLLDNTTSDYLLFLNNDLIIEDRHFGEKLLAAFLETGADIVSCHIKTPDGTTVYNGANIGIRGGNQAYPTPGEKYLWCVLIAGTAFCVKREVWKKVQMREDLFLYYEEQDWALRARKHNFRHVCAQDCIVYHEDHTRNFNSHARFYHTRNAPVVMSEHYGCWWIAFYWLYFIPVRVAYFAMLGQFKCAFAVIRGALAYLKGERGRNARAA